MKYYLSSLLFISLILLHQAAASTLKAAIDANVANRKPFEDTDLYESFIPGDMGSGKYSSF